MINPDPDPAYFLVSKYISRSRWPLVIGAKTNVACFKKSLDTCHPYSLVVTAYMFTWAMIKPVFLFFSFRFVSFPFLM